MTQLGAEVQSEGRVSRSRDRPAPQWPRRATEGPQNRRPKAAPASPIRAPGPSRAESHSEAWPRRTGPRLQAQSSILSALMKACCGISTLPNWRIFFFPAFCFSRSFFFRVASPP